MPTLLYLHGFNSSSQSKKAIQTKHWLTLNAPEVHFLCPDLPPFAKSAIDLLKEAIMSVKSAPVFVVGSSMGGFFATCLIEQYNLRGVLINPAVSPARGLESWIGENVNYLTGEKWIFEPHHIKEFQEYDPPQIKRSANYLVMLQTGDNVLDYQDAQIRYRGAKMLVESGGDHSFINYENHLDVIYKFLMTDTINE
jgi:predicted esterase YcpF (UPF0227 family)